MMNKADIFKKIGVILAELNEQYDYLAKTPESLNELEMELFMANSKFLSDHITILNKLNLPAVKPPGEQKEADENKESLLEKQPVASTPPDEPAEEPGNIPGYENEPEQTPEPEEPAIEEPATEEKTEEKEELIRFEWPAGNDEETEEDVKDEAGDTGAEPDTTQPDETTAPDVSEDNEVKAEQKEPALANIRLQNEPADEPETAGRNEQRTSSEPVINEVKQSEKTIAIPVEAPRPEPAKPAPTLNELLFARSSQGNIAAKISPQPPNDLKSTINLNDKLLFIKDLFNGYSLAYSEAIEILNRFDNLQAADTFLKTNYAAKNGWAAKQSTVDKLYAILQKRFE